MTETSSPHIHVSAGLLISDQMVLMAQRKEGCSYRGYWEFPGGKWEKRENGKEALYRELHEEIGINVLESDEVFSFHHEYPHAKVVLHFFRVYEYQNTPISNEDQVIQWQPITEMDQLQCLPAGKQEIIRYLKDQVQQAK